MNQIKIHSKVILFPIPMPFPYIYIYVLCISDFNWFMFFRRFTTANSNRSQRYGLFKFQDSLVSSIYHGMMMYIFSSGSEFRVRLSTGIYLRKLQSFCCENSICAEMCRLILRRKYAHINHFCSLISFCLYLLLEIDVQYCN